MAIYYFKMNDLRLAIDPLDALVEGSDDGIARIGLAVPTSGPLGLTGPAVQACGILAAEEVNAGGALGGRQLQLVQIDAGQAPGTVAGQVKQLLDADALIAVCGYHTSDVHRSIEQVTTGRVPYVFTPPHEGGARKPGVTLLGEDPAEQLRPVIEHFGHRRSLRRWALIGNDYIWPWAVHTTAHEMFAAIGAEVVMQEFVPFGHLDPDRLFDRIRHSRTQAVLLSLVGRDLATFNRSFRACSLRESVVRVSGALEETVLLEADGDDTGELYGAMRWFATDVGGSEFAERYARRWGPAAPAIGAYARGCYEGIHALVADVLSPPALRRSPSTIRRAEVRFARAEGLDLAVVP